MAPGPSAASSSGTGGGCIGGGKASQPSSRVVRRGEGSGGGCGGGSASPSTAADRARERLPAWARTGTPNTGESRRSGAAVGGGRRDGVARGRMITGAGGGQMGLPRRGSRGEGDA